MMCKIQVFDQKKAVTYLLPKLGFSCKFSLWVSFLLFKFESFLKFLNCKIVYLQCGLATLFDLVKGWGLGSVSKKSFYL